MEAAILPKPFVGLCGPMSPSLSRHSNEVDISTDPLYPRASHGSPSEAHPFLPKLIHSTSASGQLPYHHQPQPHSAVSRHCISLSTPRLALMTRKTSSTKVIGD